ncbi:Anthranilate synthase beta subunit 1-chloroplastic [Striga hermonthica]|uniref:anthranilate synthase n=1 Tax=Striga hermonthica TaxID=68872 RepID=A0A9N7MPA5_STRHE|nr:Anthranilate synthase beta subunit 1-chloroplastic [Striga hermonthica]
MATLGLLPYASIGKPCSRLPSLQMAQPIKSQSASLFPSTNKHLLSCSAPPRMPMAISLKTSVFSIKSKNPRGILISPGPGTPQDSGISLQIVQELGPTVPLFGVCMGLQCIGEAFGGKIVRSPYGVVHGKSSLVYYNEGGEDGLFAGLSNPFTAGRYHSLVIEKENFPSDALEITAWTEDGLIMAARHKVYRHVQGVQFHPESIITTEGKTMVHNFIKQIERMEAESKK